MTLGEIYGTALRLQNLSNSEWDAFNAFFDEHDVCNNKIKETNPLLFKALLRMKQNQAIIETMDALNCFTNGNLEEKAAEKSRELAFAGGF